MIPYERGIENVKIRQTATKKTTDGKKKLPELNRDMTEYAQGELIRSILSLYGRALSLYGHSGRPNTLRRPKIDVTDYARAYTVNLSLYGHFWILVCQVL